jgi:hypothetical protein
MCRDRQQALSLLFYLSVQTQKMDEKKLAFLTTDSFKKLNELTEAHQPKWGVMNAQEMTEHLADFYNVSLEKIKTTLLTPDEHLPKFIEFLMSDKEFKENTKAPESLIGEKPLPPRCASLTAAKEYLQKTTGAFKNYFENEPEKKTLHPVFGMLNYDQWIRLHHKHVMHHLKQFGLM